MQELKEKLLNECEKALKQRLDVVVNTINDINESLQSETKSTAGDKHETGRAMLHLEREKAGKQMAAIKEQQQLLRKVNINHSNNLVALGSIVFTDEYNYFICVSLGELVIEKNRFFAISLNTPLGKELLGKATNDIVNWRGKRLNIIKVF